MATHFFGLNDRTYRYSHTVGLLAFKGGPGFFHITDLAVGKDGVIYVLNRAIPEAEQTHPGLRVVMCTLEEEYLGDFGGYGDGDGKFIWPMSIALDSQQNVYISDEWLQRISVFDKKGRFLNQWGVMGSENGEFNRASGLAFDKEDNLYLTDSSNHRVQIFTKDGKFLDKFGEPGTGDGQFGHPWGITIDQKGDVYVADWHNDRIQKFTRNGKFLGKFGSSGDMIGQFNRPSSVAVDRDGDIYVVDWLNHRVQVFTPEFRYITEFKGDATISQWAENVLRANPDAMRAYGLVRDMSPLQRFRYPIAVDVDDQSRIIIADGPRFRLQVYAKGEMLLAGYRG